MNKGFSITCLVCNEKMILEENFLKNKDESKITSTVMGNYPFHTMYLVCSNCGNEVEVEV